MKHILICGKRQVGKSTLIRKLTSGLDIPVYGIITKIYPTAANGFQPVYLSPVGYSAEPVLVAECRPDEQIIYREAFEGPGVSLIEQASGGGIIILDELGFLESGCEKFTQAVLRAFDGSIPVLAAVKSTHPNVDFLNNVRNHPNCELHYITKENRDELYEQLSKKDIFHKALQA